ncbi:MAG: hypothetical protein JJU29_18680 [Verrucomicrobia bacterium]|nr:hypothetical protein [Verrucomicrobiota bacterium]MCH8514586.1 hypothetical protein [Kiritimatiellia bacterium]
MIFPNKPIASAKRCFAICFFAAGIFATRVLGEVKIGPADPSATIHAGTEPLDDGAVRMVGARNGSATGLVVVRTPNGTPGQVNAQVTHLRNISHPHLDIAGEVQVHYGSRRQDFGPSARRPNVGDFPYFDALTPQVMPHDDPVQPVYLHLPISEQMTPGHYRGEVVVSTPRGNRTLEVLLSITPFVVARPADRLGWVDMLQSPDSIAYRYGVPLYSPEHLRLLEPSMKMLANLGSRVMHVTAVAQTNFGNDEAMIPMSRDGIDFSGFEAYFDLYRRIVGNPTLIVLYVDEQGHERAPRWTPPGGRRDGRTGAVDAAYDEAHRERWQALMDGLHQRITAAGIDESAILLGWIGDDRNYDDRVAYWKDIAPSADWVQFTHARGDPPMGREEVLMVGSMPVRYRVLPYAPHGWKEAAQTRAGGWDLPLIQATSMRFYNNQASPVTNYRLLGPISVQGQHRVRAYRGLARMGMDFWPVRIPVDGERRLLKRFSRWHNLQRVTAPAITIPGPEGALPTVRYLNLWEGLQENEAAILIEKTLAERGDTLTEEQREKAEEILNAWRDTRKMEFRTEGNQDWQNDDPEIPADWMQRVMDLFVLASRFQ